MVKNYRFNLAFNSTLYLMGSNHANDLLTTHPFYATIKPGFEGNLKTRKRLILLEKSCLDLESIRLTVRESNRKQAYKRFDLETVTLFAPGSNDRCVGASPLESREAPLLVLPYSAYHLTIL